MKHEGALESSYNANAKINTNRICDHDCKIGMYVNALLVSGLLFASIMAYPAYSTGIVINRDKDVYVSGESVIVTGITHSPSDRVSVIIQIRNPNNELCDSQLVNVSSNGSFIARPVELSGRICTIPGVYTIMVFYGEQEGKTTFEVRRSAQSTDERLQTLLTIVNRAKQNVDNKVIEVQNKGIVIPDDVIAVYERALLEVKQVEEAVNAGDADTAKEHAKNAMSTLRQVFAALTLLEHETRDDASDRSAMEEDDLKKAEEVNELKEAIARAIEFRNRLHSIAVDSNAVADVSDNLANFDIVINEALRLVEEHSTDEAAGTLANARQILNDIQQTLIQHAKDQRQLKAKEFVDKTVSRINEMIENANAIGLPQYVIDALENAKAKLLAAKDVTEILDAAKDIKVEANDFAEHKGKNFERAVTHVESKLKEAKSKAEQVGMNTDIFYNIQTMIQDARTQWAAGETSNAVSTLENAEQILKQVNGIIEYVKDLLHQLNRLADNAEEIKAKVIDNPEALDMLDRAIELINSTKEMLVNTASQYDLGKAREAFSQTKQLIDRVREMIGDKVDETGSYANEIEVLNRIADALEDKAERLKEVADKQQNEQAINLILESTDIIHKAKQMISGENYKEARSLLGKANELLNRAERILRSNSNATDASEEQTKAVMQQIKDLEVIADDLKGRAGDNKEAHEHINQAIEDLNAAKELVKEGHFDKARSKIKDAREHLREAKQAIEDSDKQESSRSRDG
ncbi:MAG: hypothetical protein QXU32_04000 [Nitrososphaerales archaeon]